MLTVETIRKVRIAYHRDGKSICKTAKDLRLSRNTVRKVVLIDQTAFEYGGGPKKLDNLLSSKSA